MTLLWPSECVKDVVIRIIDDIAFRISGEFGIKDLNQSCIHFCIFVLMESLDVFTEHFYTLLRIASNVLSVHSPNRLKCILDHQHGSFFAD